MGKKSERSIDLGTSLRRAVRELSEGSAPDDLRIRCAELCAMATQSQIAAWYTFGLVDGEALPIDWKVTGGGEPVLSRQLHERLGWPSGDPRIPPSKWLGRFVPMSALLPDPRELDALRGSPVYTRCWEPFGLHDQLRAMVYHRGVLVGWIGALRGRSEPAFSRTDLTRLRALSEPVTTALVHAHALAQAAHAEESCDLVLAPNGRVELASTAAKRLLEHPDRAALLSTWARAADRGEPPPPVFAGHRVRWVRLTGSSGSRFLLHLDPIAPLRLHPAFELSATQRKIAELAALGMTVAEIAESIGAATSTVKTHLRVVYERLRVSNRAELTRALSPE